MSGKKNNGTVSKKMQKLFPEKAPDTFTKMMSQIQTVHSKSKKVTPLGRRIFRHGQASENIAKSGSTPLTFNNVYDVFSHSLKMYRQDRKFNKAADRYNKAVDNFRKAMKRKNNSDGVVDKRGKK